MKKEIKNPIITIKDVKPSHDFMKVDGVFNVGATKYDGKTILLMRVAESVEEKSVGIVKIPLLDKDNKLEVIELDINDKNYDFSDSRVVIDVNTNKTKYLTTISHLRLATSTDGINFEIDEKATIWPEGKLESWGIEDPRITQIEDTYYINYTAVSEYGAATALISTKDFVNYDRKGVIFPPENKDVCIFPEKIGGYYYAFNRPVPKAFGNPDIWTARSKDLVSWGEYEHFLGVRDEDVWDNGRIGGGAPSFKTEKGWIHIYHAASKDDRYCLGIYITDLNEPTKLIGKAHEPIVEPTEDYEINGFFGNVVFTCGLTIEEDIVNIYYGAADDKVCLATTTISELLEQIEFFEE